MKRHPGLTLAALVLAWGGASAQQNTTFSYQYDNNGNLTKVTDPLSQVTDRSYDVLNRQLQQLQPPPVTGAARPAINYTYDALDQLSTVRDPRNLTTTYTVDGLGWQTALASPDTNSTTYTHDNAGNVLTATDARGKTTTYTYDVLSRITGIAYASGTPTQFEYDVGANAIGRLTRMSDSSGQSSYGYSQTGRLLVFTQRTMAGAATFERSVGYAYDGNDRLQSLTYPSGNRLSYEYDAAGRVVRVTLNPGNGSGGTDTGTVTVLLDKIGYAPFGAARSWEWGNSSEQAPHLYSRSFDLDGRLAAYPLGSINGTAPVRSLTYDAASRITAMTHGANTAYDQSFGYDALGRLTSFVSANSSQSYAYDATGNRTQLGVGAATYTFTTAATSNRLSSTTGPAPARSNSYDASGNLTGDGTQTYVYNDAGRMASATRAGVTTNYLYNGRGERVAKSGTGVAGGANFYVYGQPGLLLGEYDAGGAAIEETVYLEGMPVAVLKPASNGGMAVYYVFADHLNTPRVIEAADSGAVVWRWDQADPFGAGAPDENPGQQGVFSYNLRFPGQIYDRESNNLYNYFRDYDPQTGRYIESDPIGLGGGINTYGYVEGNPVSASDPLGLVKIILLPPTDPNYAAAVNAPDIAGAFTVISHGSPQSVNHMNASQLEKFLRKRGWNPKKQPLILDACRTGQGPGSIGDQVARNSGGVVIAPSDRTWTTNWGTNFDKPYPPMSDNHDSVWNNVPNLSKPGTWNTFTSSGQITN
ncbi:type IV secretion protein Rhs [Duganella sp. FT92W]|uniref:Type IV secretion protein Rhs n=1 Tax=Pseudoduganella rivuli TaxID=2666085 RepID=A0A7X2LVU7_9BURK|nr:RHS repeat-associated core domain-containing protein [Pseudoduganella rivuli]MRV75348.1 type IV secretion protein Rhs [Pseudoduganella rivuli]